MRVEPFEPPRLWRSAGREALWNAFLSYGETPLPLAARGAGLRFARSTPPQATRPAISLLPERAPHLIAVVNAFPFQALFGAELTANDLPDLPEALHRALSEGMVGFVRDALPKGLLGDIKVLGFGSAGELAARTEPDGLEWFDVEIGGLSAEPISLTLGCERDALLAALMSVVPSARPVHSALADRLTKSVHLTLGALQLSAREIRSALVPGAMVVFPAATQGEIALRSDIALYRFAPIDVSWQCLSRQALAQGGLRPSLALFNPIRELAMQPDDPRHGQEANQEASQDQAASQDHDDDHDLDEHDLDEHDLEELGLDEHDQNHHEGEDPSLDEQGDPFSDLLDNLLEHNPPAHPAPQPAQGQVQAVPAPAQHTAPAVLSPAAELQLNVDFDLGSVTVPLSELETWQPGAVVALDPPMPGRGIEVTIRVNGFVIGSGDLVTIDDRPAVRIARLALEG